MEQIVRVHRVLPDGQAEIIHVRESACSGDCHKCSGCGAAKETLIVQARNTIGAAAGDFVTVSTDTAGVLKMAVVVYLIPMVLFFVAYAVAESMGANAVLWSCLCFVAGIALTIPVDRAISKKRQTVYTITGYAPGQGPAARKGDHTHG